jgi:hypothetical protein
MVKIVSRPSHDNFGIGDWSAMKNLFDSIYVNDIKQRILQLQPESERQWGSMTPTQAIAHCTCGMEMAMGVIRPKRAPFPASLLGVVIKPFVFRDNQPMRRNSPSAPELFLSNTPESEFQKERSRLVEKIESFASQGAPCCSQSPHPFFGTLTPDQWAILMYKHVDHHLRQFGV